MVVYAEWDTGLPSVQERIHEKYPIEGEVVPVYYGVYFHGCNLPVGCSSRKVSEGAKDGHIRQLISNSVALLLAALGRLHTFRYTFRYPLFLLLGLVG